MKVKLLAADDIEFPEFVDCYIDETKIYGYFLTAGNIDEDSVNVFFDNQTLTLKRTAVLMDWLFEIFSDQ